MAAMSNIVKIAMGGVVMVAASTLQQTIYDGELLMRIHPCQLGDKQMEVDLNYKP